MYKTKKDLEQFLKTYLNSVELIDNYYKIDDENVNTLSLLSESIEVKIPE